MFLFFHTCTCFNIVEVPSSDKVVSLAYLSAVPSFSANRMLRLQLVVLRSEMVKPVAPSAALSPVKPVCSISG